MATSARDLAITDFSYSLPDDRIARYPLPERSAAKQLIYRDGAIEVSTFAQLPEHLPAGTLLIGNRTRVIHARLFFPLAEGKRPIEIFCLDPAEPIDYAQNLGARAQVQWKVLIGGNRRWKRGSLELKLPVNGQEVTLEAVRGERQDNTFLVTFSWTTTGDPVTFGEVLAAAGTIPLPPYLNRSAEAADHERYQTVFAKTEGSVAAPTAGLHFTPAVLADLAQRGVTWAEITLHVGAGTFKPVDAPTLGGHVMHREFFTVTSSFVSLLREKIMAGDPVVSVGTTSLRCLESLFYLGARIAGGEAPTPGTPVQIGQWVAENAALTAVSAPDALAALLAWLEEHQLASFSGYTQLLLTPVASVRLASGLITNFHQPRSTLLLLIGAMVGEDWRKIYDHALNADFRFLSYGDSSLLWRKEA